MRFLLLALVCFLFLPPFDALNISLSKAQCVIMNFGRLDMDCLAHRVKMNDDHYMFFLITYEFVTELFKLLLQPIVEQIKLMDVRL